jgi:hypothetical protein
MKSNVFLLTIILFAACSQQAETEKQAFYKPSIAEYRTIQYASVKGYGPKAVMLMDNNGDILLACRKGATRDDLDSIGIPWTYSQLVLLESFRLLQRKGDFYTTTIPILDAEATGALRSEMLELAREITPAIQEETAELVHLLSNLGYNRNAFSIVFAYLLDGKVWNAFGEHDLLPGVTIDKDHPIWAGEVWSVYPKRDFSCGTNIFRRGEVAFVANWSAGILPKLKRLWKNEEHFNLMLEQIGGPDQVTSEAVLETYAPYGIFDNLGRLTIPVIEQNEENQIYHLSRRIAEILVEEILDRLDIDALQARYGFNNAGQTIIVSYHELMWDLTDALVNLGIIDLPIAFTEPEAATETDLTDLIYILK